GSCSLRGTAGVTLAPGWRHSTSSKHTASAISTAKSLFVCEPHADEKVVSPCLPPVALRYIGLVELGSVGATKLGVSSWLAMCSELPLCTKPTFPYPTRTRFLLEAAVNRLALKNIKNSW